MDDAPVWTFWIALGALAYAHVGYLALLGILSRFTNRDAKSIAAATFADDTWPSVTLVISAYNEERVLEAKLDNALAIDYPRDRLEIIVGSDCSGDATNDIASRYASRGVELRAFETRRGKTSVLNDIIPTARGQVLCLCDANVMFRPDAVKRLVSRLADPRVGAVTGQVRLASDESNFGEGESAYYGVERPLQTWESQVGSLIGVDGGMYVLRKELFQPVPADTIIDDFVISMRVIRQGRRVVYAPDAVAAENGTPLAQQEFRRRVRIAAGTVQSVKRGDFPSSIRQPVEFLQWVSHKLLRWTGPAWLLILLVSSALCWQRGVIYQVALIAQCAFYLLALAATFSLKVRSTRIGGVAFYFLMSHVATAWGHVKGMFNLQNVAWARTERKNSSAASTGATTESRSTR